MSIVGGVFKFITTGTQVWEAKAAIKAALDRTPPPKTEPGIQMREYNGNMPPPQAGAPEAEKKTPVGVVVFKVVAGVVSVACMVGETVFYVVAASNPKSPANYANEVSNPGFFHPHRCVKLLIVNHFERYKWQAWLSVVALPSSESWRIFYSA